MHEFGLSFHHFGLAVPNPEAPVAFYTSMGYRIGVTVSDPLQQVNLILCERPKAPAVEIIYPMNQGGPVSKIARTHPEGVIYHICYTTQDLERSLGAMRSSNLTVTCVSPRKPAVLFGGLCVSFYLVSGLGLIELLETDAAFVARAEAG